MRELNPIAKIGIMVGIIIGLGVAGYLVTWQPQTQQNAQDQQKLDDLKKSNDMLRHFETDMPALERQIATLKTQLAIQERIVPSEKAVDQFIHVMQDTAASAGVEIRRYTAKNVIPHDYYSELPFEMDIDGPYYSVLDFFQKVAKLERIIDIGTIAMADPTHTSDAKVKKRYTYAPGETVVASCTATTFFSHEPPSAPGKGVPAKGPAPAGGR